MLQPQLFGQRVPEKNLYILYPYCGICNQVRYTNTNRINYKVISDADASECFYRTPEIFSLLRRRDALSYHYAMRFDAMKMSD